MALHSLSVCTGVACLDSGIELAAGYLGIGPVRPVLYVEREAYAASVLAARMADGLIPSAPIWSDLCSLGGSEVGAYLDRGPRIGLFAGGIPCQPWSVAGKQDGTGDERDLWPFVAEFAAARRPERIFIENVSGFAVRDGLGRVADDLRRLGYRVAAIMLRASDVGASHGRLRLFILGVLADGDQYGLEVQRANGGAEQCGSECGGGSLADAEHGSRGSEQRIEPWREPRRNAGPQQEPVLGGGSSSMADAPRECDNRTRIGGTRRRGQLANGGPLLFAPGPNDSRWGAILAEHPWLAPSLESYDPTITDLRRIAWHIVGPQCSRRARKRAAASLAQQGYQEEVKRKLRRVADGLAAWMDHRPHRLRCVGNGVVDVQAATAFVLLWLALDLDSRREMN